MRHVLRWFVCFGFLATPLFATAEDEGRRDARTRYSAQMYEDEDAHDGSNKTPQGVSLKTYLSAQLEFFGQESLQPAFKTTKALYQFLLTALESEKEAVHVSTEALRQEMAAFTPENLEKLNSFLRSVDAELPVPFEVARGSQKALSIKTCLDALIAKEGPQVQSCRVMTFSSAASLAILSKNRDCLEMLSFLKDKNEWTFLRQHASLALHEKGLEQIVRKAVCNPELRQHLDIDVAWDVSLSRLVMPIKEKISD
jgi:hypothetical protein